MGACNSTSRTFILETARGKLKGIEQSDKSTGKPVLYRYARIPFALPPTGPLRWRRPQKIPDDFSFSDPNTGEAGDYTEFGPICPQPEYNTGAARIENPNAALPIVNVQDEDCLYLNIWVPAGAPPEDTKGGWPVQFYIHGGWLQVGNASQSHEYDPFDLLRDTGEINKRIIVAATYRLNLFGFLGGSQIAGLEGEDVPGNYGFWDQRLALEWVHSNIGLFGGDADNITVGGLSAGAHSAFFQLYYDNMLPVDQRIIRRAFFVSNALAIQPNPLTGDILTSQFDELCVVNGISVQLSSKDKLAALRQVPSGDLVKSIPKLKQHTFRAATDDDFIPSDFLASIYNGTFAKSLASSPLQPRIMIGEVRDEALLYKLVNPPSTYQDLIIQLRNYYPQSVVDRLLTLTHLYDIPAADATGPENEERFADVFAKMAADLQVHVSERGLVKHLSEHLRADRVLRYRICWRAKGLDEWLRPSVGVCHAADGPIWWASGWRAGFTDDDRAKIRLFLSESGKFLAGKACEGWYGDGDIKDGEWVSTVRLLDEEGNTRCGVKDERWARDIEVWDEVIDAQLGRK